MVIITAIALIVLVIAVILVTKAGKNTDQNTGAGSCLANGGTCKPTCATDETPLTTVTCQAQGTTPQQCCRYNFGG